MSSEVVSIANAVRGRFATVFATPNNLPVQYDNVTDEQQPSKGRRATFTIQFGRSTQTTMGGPGQRQWRTVGVALCQMFEPVGVGDGALLALFGLLQDAFRNVSLSSPAIRFQSVSMVAPPILEDGHYAATASIEFLADEYQ